MFHSMKRLLSLPVFAIAMFAGLDLKADIVYSTDFNAASGYVDGGLIGQNGWVGTGQPVSGVNPIQVANTGTNGNVSLLNTGQDVRVAYTPQTAVSLTSITLSADITVTSVQGAGDYFIHLGDNSETLFYNRIWARPGTIGGTFQLAMTTSSGTPPAAASSWGGDLTLGTMISLSSRYDIIDGAANDTGQVFVNNAFYVTANTLGADATTFASVNFRQGGAAIGPNVTIDNVSVSTVAIPEPASTALLGLGLLGLVGYRRRK